MSIKKGLGLIAVLYFTSSFQAQVKSDSAAVKEKKIDEVVLIGYGTVKKKNATSAIENVKADVFENRPIYNVTQALQGTAAGVSVVQNSGKPGQALNIKIRGNNSISSGVDPLYVVDGIQTKIAPIGGVLCAVPVTPGNHTIVLSYQVHQFTLGLSITLASALALAAAFLIFRKKEKITCQF